MTPNLSHLDPANNKLTKEGPAIKAHRKWIKELQVEVQKKQEENKGGMVDEGKYVETKKAYTKQRNDVAKVLQAAATSGTTCLDENFQDDLYDAVDIKRKAANAKKRRERGKKIKPVWALTEAEKTNRDNTE